jgi:hypothetical protein
VFSPVKPDDNHSAPGETDQGGTNTNQPDINFTLMQMVDEYAGNYASSLPGLD